MSPEPVIPQTEPSLAIIITCYNYEAYVGEAISSVLRQMRADCELVVVDDGSTDGSWDVISNFRVPAFRIPNGGQAAACLYGLERTRAPFVLFLDADDALKPGALDLIVEKLEPSLAKLQFSLGAIDGRGEPLPNGGVSLEAFRSRQSLIDRVLRSGVYRTPPTSGNVFRRDVCDLLREVDYDRAVDGVILFAAPFFGEVLSLAEELGLYRIHGSNDSGLGAAPTPALIERDLARFVARMEHLREIIRRTTGRRLIDPARTFYYQELRLQLAIASRRRLSIGQVLRFLAATRRESSFSAREKLLRSAFAGALFVLPKRSALQLLTYRLQTGGRSLARTLSGHKTTPALAKGWS